ncbi:hypothetical protein MUN88_09900 [Gracilibacillus caseinilyticus]|uniref:Uncharacterized protein n=1 Tax=Gracilibacillus caseinilyticus TaxID=2932256 RepID=A0ABY4F1C6_9BACI|nr:hypothetical protein [Gracilibacillus caseinilyticus]UOQ50338.1 hypothetical protein MUN88_09900 [Gracilibacillus caseinilyticus]
MRDSLITQTKQDFEKLNNKLEKENRSVTTMASSCPGLNHVGESTDYYYIGLDHCITKDLIYLLGVSAGLATIATAIAAPINIGAGVATGIAAGLLAIGTATVSYHSNGSGIALTATHTDPPVVVSIGSQT